MPNDNVPVVQAYDNHTKAETKLVVIACPYCGRHHIHDTPSPFSGTMQPLVAPCTKGLYEIVRHEWKSIDQAGLDILRVRDEEPERLTRDPNAMRQLCAVLDEVNRLNDCPGDGWRHGHDHYPSIPSAVLVLLKRYHWALPDPHGHTEFSFMQGFRSIGEPIGTFTYLPTGDESCPEAGMMTYAELLRLARVELFKSFISQDGAKLLINEDAHAALEDFCRAVYGEWAKFCDRLEWRRDSQSKCDAVMKNSPTV